MSMRTALRGTVPEAETYRVAAPEQTWARIEPLMPAAGITRVADVTGLDDIGIPVYLAVRPTARTLSVSQGKGLTPLLSKISAVMESLETWHAERPHLAPVATGPADGLVDYDVRALPLVERSLVGGGLVLEWVAAEGLVTGRRQLAPLAAVRLDARIGQGWETAYFAPTSNGLASGNVRDEAVLHGLLELIERECTTAVAPIPLAERRYTDPRTATSPAVHWLLDAFASAGCWVEVCDATNDLGIACYVAYTWAADVPVMFAGAGCHPDPATALIRALTEAAQSRLTLISGTRDDFGAVFYAASRELYAPPPLSQPATVPVPVVDHVPDLAECAARVAARTGVEPFAVDLTRPDLGIPVWRVFAPGLRFTTRHEVTRG